MKNNKISYKIISTWDDLTVFYRKTYEEASILTLFHKNYFVNELYIINSFEVLVYLYKEFFALVVKNTFFVRSICHCSNGWVPLIHRISKNSVQMAECFGFIGSVKQCSSAWVSLYGMTIWWKIFYCSIQERGESQHLFWLEKTVIK